MNAVRGAKGNRTLEAVAGARLASASRELRGTGNDFPWGQPFTKIPDRQDYFNQSMQWRNRLFWPTDLLTGRNRLLEHVARTPLRLLGDEEDEDEEAPLDGPALLVHWEPPPGWDDQDLPGPPQPPPGGGGGAGAAAMA